MLRARLRLGAALVGFLIVLTELGFALYCEVSFHRLLDAPRTGIVALSPQPSLYEQIVLHLPNALLALASLIGGVVLYRAIRGRSDWSWNLAVLAPVAAFLVIWKPSVTHVQLVHVDDLIRPWVAPVFWTHLGSGNAALSIGLQIVPYLAAASYVLTAVLALPRREPRNPIEKAVAASGFSAR